MLTRRELLIVLLLAGGLLPVPSAWASDDNGGSDNSGSGSGSGNSGSGSDTSGSYDSGDDDDGNVDGGNSGSGSQNSGKYKDQYDAREAVSSGKAIALEQALKKLRARYPGKVISVNLGESGGRLLYWFKVKSSDGSVRKVVMDAKTGRLRGLFGFEGS
jgi:Peptidase propeptide and YPEB domain